MLPADDFDPAPEVQALVGVEEWVEAQMGPLLRQAVVAGRLEVPRLPDGVPDVRDEAKRIASVVRLRQGTVCHGLPVTRRQPHLSLSQAAQVLSLT